MYDLIDIYVKTPQGKWCWLDSTRMSKTLVAARVKAANEIGTSIQNIKTSFANETIKKNPAKRKIMATAKKSARKYDLFSVNVKGGAETQMNSSPLTHSQAVTMKSKLTNHPHRRLELREVSKSNPAARKTVHRVGVSETAYVRRPSQITRKTPTKRLVKRRVKKVAAPKATKGFFPNPIEKRVSRGPIKFVGVTYQGAFGIDVQTPVLWEFSSVDKKSWARSFQIPPAIVSNPEFQVYAKSNMNPSVSFNVLRNIIKQFK